MKSSAFALLIALTVSSVGFAQETSTSTPSTDPLHLSKNDRMLQFAVGAAATVVSVPVGILLGEAIGGASNNYLVALPAVLTWALLPPLAITTAEWLYGNHLVPGSSRLSPALWLALGTNVVIIVASILLGADARNPLHLVLITAASLLMPAVVTGSMIKWAPTPTPQQAWREDSGQSPLFHPAAAFAVGVPL